MLKKANATHDQVIAESKKWVDDEPPKVALHYRKILRKTPFTRGGFPRIDSFKPKEKRKSPETWKPAAKGSPCLPGRRGNPIPNDLSEEMIQQEELDRLAQSRTQTAMASTMPLPTGFKKKPHWALTNAKATLEMSVEEHKLHHLELDESAPLTSMRRRSSAAFSVGPQRRRFSMADYCDLPDANAA